jgi:hypothetical protein
MAADKINKLKKKERESKRGARYTMVESLNRVNYEICMLLDLFDGLASGLCSVIEI